MGQILKAKNYTYFGMEKVSYTTYSLNSTKPSKKSPTCKRIALSVSLLAARLEPLSPGSVSSLVRLRPSALRLSPKPALQFGSLLPPSLPISATATPAWQTAGASPSQRQRPSTSMKEAGTIYYYGFVMAVIT